MDTEKASHWSQIVVVVPSYFCAYAAWVQLRSGQATAGPFIGMSPAVGWVAFGAFLGLGTLWLVLWLASFRHKSTPTRPTALRVLERYYIALAGLRDHIDRLLWLANETGKDSGLMDVEMAVEKIRAELMNMAPDIFPVATALDFQKPPAAGHVDLRERLPKTADELLKTIHKYWSRYAEKAGISPLRFRDTPIVKLHD